MMLAKNSMKLTPPSSPPDVSTSRDSIVICYEADGPPPTSDTTNVQEPTIVPFSQLGLPPEKHVRNNPYIGRRGRVWLELAEKLLLFALSITMLTCLVFLAPVILVCAVLQRIYVARMRHHSPPSGKRIAVIGGGWSGLQCMARLHELGFDVHGGSGRVRGFERYDGWGGTWHPALRYHNLQVHGAMWITSFKDFPYSKDKDVNDGKVLGEELMRYVERFGDEKKLMDAYTFNAQVIEIKYSSGDDANDRMATIVLKNSKTGETWTEGPFDLVIYAAQASEPQIPNIPHREKFKGEAYHSSEFKKEQYEDITKNGKKVVIVGGSKTGCDLALSFQRSGYYANNKVQWLYRKPYHFLKYEAMFHDRSLLNIFRGFTTITGMLMFLLSERLGGWIFWTSGLAVSPHGDTPSGPPRHNDWSKFHFGVLCPKQRRDLANIPAESIIRGNPQAFTETGLKLSNGTDVIADVVLFATGYESGIDKIHLSKDGAPYKLQSQSKMLDHFIVSDYPVLANATALWTTFGPIRAVNAADMTLYHLCIRRSLSDSEIQRSVSWQFGSTNAVKSLIFTSEGTSMVKAFVIMHFDLMIRGNVNVLDFLTHVVEVFCLSKQSPLKMRFPIQRNDETAS